MKEKKTPDQWFAMAVILAILACFAFAMLTGCAGYARVTEADRHLIDQSIKAMEQVEVAISGTVAVIAGGDVTANLRQLQAVFGPPAEPSPYSHQNSASAREKSAADHAESPVWGFLKTAFGIAAPFLLGGGAVGIAGRWLPWLLPAGRALKEFVKKVDAEMPEEVTKRIVNSNPIVKKVWDAIPDQPPPTPPNPS